MNSERITGAISALGRLIVAGGLVAGCVPGSEYTPPSMRLSDRYALLLPAQAPAEAETHWWRAFRDPVLDRLVEEALGQNLSLADARARLAEAEAIAAREGYRVGGSGSAELRDGPGKGLADSAEVGLTATFDLNGRQRHLSKAAAARLQASEFGVAEARRTLLSQLVLAYTDLRFFQYNKVLRQKDQQSRRLTLRDIETLLASGAATDLDRVRAQSLLAETQAELPRLDAGIVRQRNRIGTLLGRPAGDLPVDLSAVGSLPQPKLGAKIGVPADLLRNRPDIRRAERLYAAAVSEIDAAEAARYPSLSLSGLIQAPLRGGGANESLTAGLSIPVFSQGALQAGVKAQEARASQAYLQWRLAVLTAVEEVESNLASLHASRRTVNSSREVVRLNEQALGLSRKLLETGGSITVLDLLDRERAISTSRSDLAQAQRDLAANFISLHVALGFGLEEAPTP